MNTATLTPAYPDFINEGERSVIDCLIRDALASDCLISIYDGEDRPVTRSTDYTEITREIAATDITTIRVEKMDGATKRSAVFVFVHGNLPSEVLSDMTDSDFANELFVGAEACADALEARGM